MYPIGKNNFSSCNYFAIQIEKYVSLIKSNWYSNFVHFDRFSKDDDLLKRSLGVSDRQMISTSGGGRQRLDITELDTGKIVFC